MKKQHYVMKFYKGRKLIAERTWDANESFLDEITYDTESLIEEAIQCNPPAETKKQRPSNQKELAL